MSQRIRVAITDDHGVLRGGLRALIAMQPDMEVVGEASTGEEAVKLALTCRPDVVLMDVALPGMDGLEATRQILALYPACRVLILTVHQQTQYLLAALKAGASGYVVKSDLDTELLSAIRAAYQNDMFIYSADTKAFFQAYLEREPGGLSPQRLSSMEERVLRLSAQGHTAQEIGRSLCISPNSVATYRRRVMEKLGLGCRAELFRWALQHGLLAEEQG